MGEESSRDLPRQGRTPAVAPLAPGGATGQRGDPPIHEAGSRETAVVTEGKLRLVCDGAPYDLAEGDCVTFDADLPHLFENNGEADAALLAVLSAGLRRS